MGLFNPRQIVTDAVALAHRYAVFVAELVKRHGVGIGANLTSRGPVQLGLLVLVCGLPVIPSAYGFADTAAAAGATSIPSHHIPHVVGLSAEYNVSRIDAGWIVASVAADHAFGNGAVEQNVGDLGVVPSPTIINQLEGGIPLLVLGPLPNPAVAFNEVISMKSLNKAVAPHNYAPVGGFPAQYTGKGGYCGR